MLWLFFQVAAVSGVVEISGNNLAGKAELNDFTLNLKWSKIGNFHMYLIQVCVMLTFISFLPFLFLLHFVEVFACHMKSCLLACVCVCCSLCFVWHIRCKSSSWSQSSRHIKLCTSGIQAIANQFKL